MLDFHLLPHEDAAGSKMVLVLCEILPIECAHARWEPI